MHASSPITHLNSCLDLLCDKRFNNRGCEVLWNPHKRFQILNGHADVDRNIVFKLKEASIIEGGRSSQIRMKIKFNLRKFLFSWLDCNKLSLNFKIVRYQIRPDDS